MDKILKIRLGRDVKDYLSITFGLMCYALGWAAFLLPYQITTGGVTGISAIIYYVTCGNSSFLFYNQCTLLRIRIEDTRPQV